MFGSLFWNLFFGGVFSLSPLARAPRGRGRAGTARASVHSHACAQSCSPPWRGRTCSEPNVDHCCPIREHLRHLLVASACADHVRPTLQAGRQAGSGRRAAAGSGRQRQAGRQHTARHRREHSVTTQSAAAGSDRQQTARHRREQNVATLAAAATAAAGSTRQAQQPGQRQAPDTAETRTGQRQAPGTGRATARGSAAGERQRSRDRGVGCEAGCEVGDR